MHVRQVDAARRMHPPPKPGWVAWVGLEHNSEHGDKATQGGDLGARAGEPVEPAVLPAGEVVRSAQQ